MPLLNVIMKSAILAHSMLILACSMLASAGAAAQAQTLEGAALVSALQQGGYVVVMRHASSPGELPEAGSANPDNVNGERQLDEQGRQDATAMGEAWRRLNIPVAGVASSPTYRALETARLAGFTDVAVQDELSNEGMRDSNAVQVAWLHTQVAIPPVDGNRVLITHGPNLNAAFPDLAAGMDEGEALVFDPEAADGPALVARVKIGEWSSL